MNDEGTPGTKSMLNPKKAWLWIATSALALAAILPAAPVDVAQAGGTEPSTSGSYMNVVWNRYFDGHRIDSVARVDKLTNEVNPYRDYYSVTNIMRQQSGKAWYDWPNFWTSFGEGGTVTQPAAIPDEVDYDPGFSSANSPVTFDVEIGTGGFNMLTHWNHDWTGDWEIGSQEPWQSDDGWTYGYHHEWFSVGWCDGCGGRTHDWDRLTHGTTWGVNQGKHHWLWIANGVFYCNDYFDCFSWDDPDTWQGGTWVGFDLPPEEDETCTQTPLAADPQVRAVCATTEAVPVPSTVPGLPSPHQLVMSLNLLDSECNVELVLKDCDGTTPEDLAWWAEQDMEDTIKLAVPPEPEE